jgi:hypothetical protein
MNPKSVSVTETDSDIRNNILSNLTDLINKCSSYELDILNNIIDKNKLEKLIEQQINRDNAKIEYEKTLEIIVEEFLKKNKNTYWYNKANESYYRYVDDVIESINSDQIIIEITDMIPEEYYKNKSVFRRHLLNKIQTFNFINQIELSKSTINNCRQIISPLLDNPDFTEYIFITIGYSIFLNSKNNLDIAEININNQHFYNTTHHLWFGNSVADFLEGIRYWIYDKTKIYPKFLSKIKTSYNHYSTDNLYLVSFKDLSKTELNEQFRILKAHKMELILTSIYYYRMFSQDASQFEMPQMVDKKIIYQQFADKYITVSSVGTLRLKDIQHSIIEYLHTINLPNNLYTIGDIKECMSDIYQIEDDSKYSSIYRGFSFKNIELEHLFNHFVDDNINPSDSQRIRFGELYFFFKKWFIDLYPDLTCPTKTELKQIADKTYQGNFDDKLQLYTNLVINGYNKLEIFDKYISENVIEVTNDENFIKLDELVVSFSNWFNSNYDNLPNIHKDDLRELMNHFYLSKQRKWKGWINLKFSLKLSLKDQLEMEKDIKLSNSY